MAKSANLLKPHSASWLPTQRPPLEHITRYVETGDVASDHWFWVPDPDARYPRRFSEHGHAIISWSPKANIKKGIFCVARLLLEAHKGPFPARASFTSVCGLIRCVNPDHWRWLEPAPRYRFDPAVHGWQVAERRTGRVVAKRLLLEVRDQHGVVHVVDVHPRSVSRFVAMCGAVIIPDFAVVLAKNAVVTCTGGC